MWRSWRRRPGPRSASRRHVAYRYGNRGKTLDEKEAFGRYERDRPWHAGYTRIDYRVLLNASTSLAAARAWKRLTKASV